MRRVAKEMTVQLKTINPKATKGAKHNSTGPIQLRGFAGSVAGPQTNVEKASMSVTAARPSGASVLPSKHLQPEVAPAAMTTSNTKNFGSVPALSQSADIVRKPKTVVKSNMLDFVPDCSAKMFSRSKLKSSHDSTTAANALAIPKTQAKRNAHSKLLLSLLSCPGGPCNIVRSGSPSDILQSGGPAKTKRY